MEELTLGAAVAAAMAIVKFGERVIDRVSKNGSTGKLDELIFHMREHRRESREHHDSQEALLHKIIEQNRKI